MRLTAIEGNLQRLDGGSMYGNAPREVWKNWSPPDERNRIPLACRGLLFEPGDGRRILFETGVGAFFEPKLRERFGVEPAEHLLLENLRKHGLSDESIDIVVLSHLHFDHAGGMLSAFDGNESRLLFPKAKYYVGREQWERARKPHSRDRASYVPPLNALLEKSGRLVLVDRDRDTDLAPLIKFRFSDGHTPGLMMSRIALPKGPLVFVSDLIPASPWVHVPITMGYDRYPELLIEEKQKLLEEMLKENGALFFTHDPTLPCGRVKQDPKGRFSVDSLSLQDLG